MAMPMTQFNPMMQQPQQMQGFPQQGFGMQPTVTIRQPQMGGANFGGQSGYLFANSGFHAGGVSGLLNNINGLLHSLVGGIGGGQQQPIQPMTPQSMGIPHIPSVNSILNTLPGMPGGPPRQYPPQQPQHGPHVGGFGPPGGLSAEHILLLELLQNDQLFGPQNNSGWDDDDWDWDDDDNGGGGGSTINNNTTGSEAIIDTIDVNDYDWTGDNRTINFEGNEGDNDFDVRDLNNSIVNIGTLDAGAFDSSDRIRLNVPSDGSIQISEETTNGGTGKRFKIADGNGNVITIHTDGDPGSIQALLPLLTDASNNPLEGNINVDVVDPGEIEDPEGPPEPPEQDPNRPDWLPIDYSGEHYEPELDRGFREIGSTNDVEAYGQIVQFDVNTEYRTHFNLTGDQAQFISHISKDQKEIDYNIDATNSRLDLVVGNDDWINIDHDPDTLIAIGEIEHSDITGGYQMTFFDPNTGNLFVVHGNSSGDYYSGSPSIIEAKLRGRFKGPGE